MYRIYYENNFRESVCFTSWPYMVTGGDIFDGKWDEIENEDHIQGFERKIQDKTLDIEIKAIGAEFRKAVDVMNVVFERDILASKPGKLWVGDSYMKCYITESSKDGWVSDIDIVSDELKIIADYPYWIREVEYPPFRKEASSEKSSALGLDYEYEYEYEYSGDQSVQYLVNDHYTDSGFRLIITGPCINPAIRIGGHLYELRTTLYDDEYAVIDSSTRYTQDRSVYKVQKDGTKVDLFNARNKDSEIWQKIPPGKSTVTWNGNFRFDITLFNERGAPRWTL